MGKGKSSIVGSDSLFKALKSLTGDELDKIEDNAGSLADVAEDRNTMCKIVCSTEIEHIAQIHITCVFITWATMHTTFGVAHALCRSPKCL